MATDEAPPLISRAERKAATRERLLEAATTVFSERGYHGASVQAIASAAGFTKGAVYANFSGKEELFLAIMDRRLDAQKRRAEAIEQLDDTDVDPDELAAHLDESFNERWALMVYEAVLYAVRQSPELRAELAARWRMVDEWTERYLRDKAADPPESIPALAMAQSALGEGLMLRRLVAPDEVTAEVLDNVIETVFDHPCRRAWQDTNAVGDDADEARAP